MTAKLLPVAGNACARPAALVVGDEGVHVPTGHGRVEDHEIAFSDHVLDLPANVGKGFPQPAESGPEVIRARNPGGSSRADAAVDLRPAELWRMS